MSAVEIGIEDLTEGSTYTVSFKDCCVAGSVTGRLVRIVEDKDGDVNELVFEHARFEGPLWGLKFEVAGP